MKNNLPKKKPPKFKELIVPSVQSTNALTMDLKAKKVPIYFCGNSDSFWLSYTTIIGSGTRMVKKLYIRFERGSGKLEMLRVQSQKKRRKFL